MNTMSLLNDELDFILLKSEMNKFIYLRCPINQH